jgi:phospholipid/cholesterol/gamma-HCH transport system substrate-binding protein
MTSPAAGPAEPPREEFVSKGVITTSIKIQLVAFLLVTVISGSYLLANYVGVGKSLFGGHGCTVSADFTDSGGIFTNAEATYRGVTVGRVGKLHITKTGVRVDVKLDNCDHPRIPASSQAIITDRSVIGEQYVNFIPRNGNGPYLSAGQVIPQSRTGLPISVQTLLTNVDHLIRSVDTTSLNTVVTELGTGFNNTGPALGQMIDATDALLTVAQRDLPQTLALIESSNTVLATQLAEKPALDSFTHSLNLLSQQLKASDADIRSLLDQGPSDLATLSTFVQDNRTDLGVVLANLATVGDLLVRHRDGLEQILFMYPLLAATGFHVTGHRAGVESLGFVLNVNDPPDCGDPASAREGYNATKLRPGGDLSPQAPNVAAHCATVNPKVNVRGSAHVPGGDPISVAGGGQAYPRVTTESVSSGLGDASWLAVLTDGLH